MQPEAFPEKRQGVYVLVGELALARDRKWGRGWIFLIHCSGILPEPAEFVKLQT